MKMKKMIQIPENVKLTELFSQKKRLDRSIEDLNFTELSLLRTELLDLEKQFHNKAENFTNSLKMIGDEIKACDRHLQKLIKRFCKGGQNE